MIRTRDQWLKKFHTNASRNIAKYSLKNFDQYIAALQTNETELIESFRQDEDERYFFLDGIVQYLNEGKKSPGTIKTIFPFVRSYLRFMGIRTTSEDVKDYVSFVKSPKETRKPITKETIALLLSKSNRLYTALLLTLASSGMRVSEALALRKDDIQFGDITKINLRAGTTKTQQERDTFISRQATDAIERYGVEDTIFPTTLENCELYISELRNKLGLLEKYSNNRNYHVHIHALRSFFHTEATLLHGVEYAHAVIGHGSYLQQYFRLTDEVKEQKYRELEPHVTIHALSP